MDGGMNIRMPRNTNIHLNRVPATRTRALGGIHVGQLLRVNAAPPETPSQGRTGRNETLTVDNKTRPTADVARVATVRPSTQGCPIRCVEGRIRCAPVLF